MLVVLLGIFAVQVPLAYVLPHHTSLGVYGTRWAIVMGTAVIAACYAAYFHLGRWQRKTV
jgi:Na+-driven multidrug efflux pump